MLSAELSILVPAFLAGLLVLATHVPLGRLVLERGIVFIDLAIAQVAGLGVVAADVMGWEPQGWSVQFSAATAALGEFQSCGWLLVLRRIEPIDRRELRTVRQQDAEAVIVPGANVSLLGQPFLEKVDEIVIRQGEMRLRSDPHS